MKIIIHQALCGESKDNEEAKKGFILLRTTLEDRSLALRLSPKTNMSDLPPSGIGWTSSVRGFPVENYYLIIKTYLDTSPNVRQGRMFSHVLIISKSDIKHVRNISTLFDVFQKTLNKDLKLEIIEYEVQKEEIISATNREKKVAQAIVDGIKSIVWIGEVGFENMINIIWRGLDFESRFNLHFGVQFNPAEIKFDRFNILTTPDTLRSKWYTKERLLIVDLHESDTNISLGAKSILGDVESIAKIQNFQAELETIYPTIDQLQSWQYCIDANNKLKDETIIFQHTRQLAQLVCQFSPDVKKGNIYKQSLLTYLIGFLDRDKVSLDNILSLKMLELRAIKDSEQKLYNSLEKWCERWLFDKVMNEKESLFLIIQTSLNNRTTASSWWKNSVRNTILNKLNNWKISYAEICWMWVNEYPNTFEVLSTLFPKNDKQIERDLVASFTIPSNIGTNVLSDIIDFTSKKKWYMLHAVLICELHKSVSHILKMQIGVDVDTKSLEGLEYIANRFSPLDFIRESVHIEDERLWIISGRLLPQINVVEIINYSYTNWFYIIYNAIRQGASLDTLFKYPEGFTHNMLDSILQGELLPDELWSITVSSKATNIYDYEQRAKAWEIIPLKYRNDFLYSTAVFYLESEDKKIILEKELDDYLCNRSFLQTYFSKNNQNISIILDLFSKIDIRDETLLSNYIYGYNGSLQSEEANQLGDIIFKKTWRKCAERVYEKANINSSFRPTLQKCYSLLSLLQRLEINISNLLTTPTISEDEWWNSLIEIASKLYPKGASDSDVWEKAGGDNSNLYYHTSGQESWRKALNGLRNGRYNNITIGKLLDEMIKKHPSNSDLKKLRQIKSKL
ncbi:MAG: effector-associated domain EAD1-containing protein [Dysgonomonas mossii]|uniref:GAP1-N1 domain-containing protein n=1 Tax=Dysgonomonas mossii TaxID=163665 RepID=UPI003993198D